MSYKADVSRQVKRFLEALSRRDKGKSRELALLLLRLEKTPRPRASRVLPSHDKRESRVFESAGFLIAYRIDEGAGQITIGLVKESR